MKALRPTTVTTFTSGSPTQDKLFRSLSCLLLRQAQDGELVDHWQKRGISTIGLFLRSTSHLRIHFVSLPAGRADRFFQTRKRSPSAHWQDPSLHFSRIPVNHERNRTSFVKPNQLNKGNWRPYFRRRSSHSTDSGSSLHEGLAKLFFSRYEASRVKNIRKTIDDHRRHHPLK